MKRKKFLKVTFCLFTFNALYTPQSHSMALPLAHPLVIGATALAAASLAQLCYRALKCPSDKSIALAHIRSNIQSAHTDVPSYSLDPTSLTTELRIAPAKPHVHTQEEHNAEQPPTHEYHQKSYEYIPIPYGFKLKNKTGLYCSAALAQPHAQAERAAALLAHHIQCINLLQSNPVYAKKFSERFYAALLTLHQTNSDDLITRIYARLAFPSLALDGIYGVHLAHAKDYLLRTFFTKCGRLRSVAQYDDTRTAFAQFIGACCINPATTMANLPAQQEGNSTPWWEKCARFGRKFFDIKHAVAHNQENKVLSDYIRLYQQCNFSDAHALLKQVHHKELFYQVDAYFKNYYQCTPLKKIISTTDPLLDYIEPEQETACKANLAHLEQLVRLLENRKAVVSTISTAWNLPSGSLYEQALYFLLDQHAFENPLNLVKTICAYSASLNPHQADQLIRSFFLPTGILKDFAQYDTYSAQEYLLDHKPTLADLEQLYVINLLMIMGNCTDSNTVCATYALLNEWEQAQAPAQWCEMPHKSDEPIGPCFPQYDDNPPIIGPCFINPEQPSKSCGTGKIDYPESETNLCGTAKQNKISYPNVQCGHGGQIVQKNHKTDRISPEEQSFALINTFKPEDFENFDEDFPNEEEWKKTAQDILNAIEKIRKEDVNEEETEKFLKVALGKSWDHIFSKDHIRKKILELGASKEEIIQIIRMIILQLYKENKLKEACNHIDTTINGYKVYIKIFLHNNGLPRSVNCFRDSLIQQTRKIGNIIEWIKK